MVYLFAITFSVVIQRTRCVGAFVDVADVVVHTFETLQTDGVTSWNVITFAQHIFEVLFVFNC